MWQRVYSRGETSSFKWQVTIWISCVSKDRASIRRGRFRKHTPNIIYQRLHNLCSCIKVCVNACERTFFHLCCVLDCVRRHVCMGLCVHVRERSCVSAFGANVLVCSLVCQCIWALSLHYNAERALLMLISTGGTMVINVVFCSRVALKPKPTVVWNKKRHHSLM